MIVGDGARSTQTQDNFRKKDTIAQSDTTVTISDMRKAITNVVLNMTISPGVILVPSDMTILEKKIPGYNNVLTLATSSMGFGVNTNLNYPGVVKKKEKNHQSDQPSSHLEVRKATSLAPLGVWVPHK